MTTKETTYSICNAIAEAAEDDASKSKKLGLDVYLDETYVGVAVTPDRKFYTLASRPEEYSGDYEHEEDVYVEQIVFPCMSISSSGDSIVFNCIDPLDEKASHCITIKQAAASISQALASGTIHKAFISIDVSGRRSDIAFDKAMVMSCDPCEIDELKVGNISQKMLVLGLLEVDHSLDINYMPVVDKLAQDKCDEDMGYSRSMKRLGERFYEDESGFHEYVITFYTRQQIGQTNRIDLTAQSIEDAMMSFNDEVKDLFPHQDVIEVIKILCDGKPVSKKILAQVNQSFLDECDGGAAGAGGGDGGGAAGGDAGNSASAPAASLGDAGDTAAEMAGTTTTEVLGKCKPGEGYMGKDNFYIPVKAQVPLHRWEIANGGSKRKKKNKKYDYEKGMKVVVSMFEDEDDDEQ